jgi:hypothetical protein
MILVVMLLNLQMTQARGEQVSCDVAIQECNRALLATEAELNYTKKERDFYKDQGQTPKLTWEEKLTWGIVGMAIGVIVIKTTH